MAHDKREESGTVRGPVVVEIVPKLKRTLPPLREGQTYYKALIAGGNTSIFLNVAAQLERAYPIKVTHHLERLKEFTKPLPHNLDLVIVLTNYIGHHKTDHLVAQAKDRKVQIIFSTHKLSDLMSRLKAYGLEPAARPNPTPPLSKKIEPPSKSEAPKGERILIPPAPVPPLAEDEASKLKKEQEAAELAELERQIKEIEAQEAAARAVKAEPSVDELVRLLAKAMRRERVDKIAIEFNERGKALVTITEPEA